MANACAIGGRCRSGFGSATACSSSQAKIRGIKKIAVYRSIERPVRRIFHVRRTASHRVTREDDDSDLDNQIRFHAQPDYLEARNQAVFFIYDQDDY